MKDYLRDFTPEAICDAVNRECGLAIAPLDISYPPQQGRDAQTVFVDDLVIKFFKPILHAANKIVPAESARLAYFEREQRILADLHDNSFGLIVPRLIYSGCDVHMFAMEKLAGQTLREKLNDEPDFLKSRNGEHILNHIADSMIGFHAIMKDKPTIPHQAWHMKSWIANVSEDLPSFAAPLADFVRAAKAEAVQRSPHGWRFQHYDPKPDNFILQKNGKLGLIDFGYAQYGDPHLPLALIAVQYKDGLDVALSLASCLNGRSPDGPWIDKNRMINLAAVHLAHYAQNVDFVSLARRESHMHNHMQWLRSSVQRFSKT